MEFQLGQYLALEKKHWPFKWKYVHKCALFLQAVRRQKPQAALSRLQQSDEEDAKR